MGRTVDRSGPRCNRWMAERGRDFMRVSILGGGGFLGRKVAARLAMDGVLGSQPITGLTLFDLAMPPKPPAAFPVAAIAGDLVDMPPEAIPPGTDIVIHLAAVVSAQAEAD